MIRPLFLSAVLGLTSLSQTAHGQSVQTVTLDFLPPEMAPRDICGPAEPALREEDQTAGGDAAELTDKDRIRFLRRDIRVYAEEDANAYFDFIEALIARRGEIDPEFPLAEQTFARIDLWLQAGRLEALQESGLIEGLRTQIDTLGNNQRVALARFYADGIGVAQDIPFAQELIREAAYGGNARALLEIARLAQNGALVEGWDAPLDLTITMAFGGILGALDAGVCRRAEQIAQAYVDGDVVTANPALALAWFRFAADMGRAEAAWRVVEHYMNADAAHQDNIALRHYLEQAVRRGISVSAAQQTALTSSGAVSQPQLEEILGFNHSAGPTHGPGSLSSLFQLRVKIDKVEPNEDSLILDYLREIIQMPQAPGRVFDRLAGEALVRKGRWAAEAEAIALLEEAVQRGDGSAKRRLAGMLMRYRDDPAQVARAESLLMDAVAAHGDARAMRDLDRLYRCQVNDAPRLRQADVWQASYAASGHQQVTISSGDLMALAPSRAPETIALIQTLALQGRPQMVASQAHRVQADPLASDAERRFWAAKVNRSDQALEAFAELEFNLARTPAERDLAVELFRRVYLNNGVATALDLAIALVKYDARDPEVANEIVTLLTIAGNRGEGGAIRLLSNLQAGTRSEAEVYAQFADKIEARGDFLALMFAIPHIASGQVDDYIDRAVSLMSCGTKDADELGDAHAIRGQAMLSHQWRQIGLHFEGGHVLSKLRLSNRQVAFFEDGKAPDPVAVAQRSLAEGDPSARSRLIALTMNPGLETYDPQLASQQLSEAFAQAALQDRAALAALYRAAPSEVQETVAQGVDINALLRVAAQTGDAAAAYEYAMILRAEARAAEDLTASARWLEQAAQAGHTQAMYAFGHVLGYGLGRERDTAAALKWLGLAETAGHREAAKTARLVRLQSGF